MSLSSNIRLIIIIVLFIFITYPSYSQDSVKQKRFVFNGYIKDMPTVIFQDIKGSWITGNLIHNRLNCKWLISPAFTASLELRNRLFFGNMLSSYPGYDKTFETDNGLTSLSKNIVDEKSFLFNMAVDRFWVQYSGKKVQITLGRQRINWGQTFVWNPNDIFNSYSYFDFDYEEKPGSDALRIQYFTNATSVLELAAKINNNKKITAAGLYRFNKWNYDFQFLGGVANQQDLVIGTGWSGEILKGGFRGEASYFHPIKNFTDTTGVFMASAGYDYTFKNSLFLQFEALYNGNKDTANTFSLSQLNNSNTSAQNLFLSDFSVFTSISYPITPLISGSLAGIANFRNRLLIVMPALTFSLKENLELSISSQLIPINGDKKNKQNVYLFFTRLKYSF